MLHIKASNGNIKPYHRKYKKRGKGGRREKEKIERISWKLWNLFENYSFGFNMELNKIQSVIIKSFLEGPRSKVTSLFSSEICILVCIRYTVALANIIGSPYICKQFTWVCLQAIYYLPISHNRVVLYYTSYFSDNLLFTASLPFAHTHTHSPYYHGQRKKKKNRETLERLKEENSTSLQIS